MTDVFCVPGYYIWTLMIVSFVVGYVMPIVGQFIKEKYGGTEQN